MAAGFRLQYQEAASGLPASSGRWPAVKPSGPNVLSTFPSRRERDVILVEVVFWSSIKIRSFEAPKHPLRLICFERTAPAG